ncbi:molybdate ABC transporter substrate-binding protein [Aquimarina sp. RZ0]|uniref:molybdate ABC transporter substrate-binding protein n=1 Tax=Aquimarina sp. RZ0 TaxID=2607730 RepID=UPI0011F1AC10|nr:molybdate ABC transporter substrate-binding protein [Aquimarina sp. RZ0]KAA1246788.1 molybdate ABC transporter substrate-binding protein [Aquimarina sp. RZ0]
MKCRRPIHWLIISFAILCFACKEKKHKTVVIATAANMQYAIEEISKIFTEQTGIHCKLVISSSGKLTAQIKEGAPYDIFVAANMKYPNDIYKNNLSVHPPEVYGYGQLVLWTLYENIQPTVKILRNHEIRHIAVANPKTAPYGEAAVEVLKHYKLYDTIHDKLVYGESISQTNQFISSKSAQIGFTAKSVVLSSGMKDKGIWIEIDTNVHAPINQGVVMIKGTQNDLKVIQQFYDFLFSLEAKEILKDFGYLVSE